jgi:hypothetical protein
MWSLQAATSCKAVWIYMFDMYISVFQGNILKFDSIKKEHRGTYYCVATNVVGTGARRNIDVEVSTTGAGRSAVPIK